MLRTILALALPALLAATFGCRSCANTSDYCGPLAGGCESCSHCGHETRHGSILGGSGDVYEEEGTIIEDGEAVEEQAMAPQPDPYAYQQPQSRAPRRIVR